MTSEPLLKADEISAVIESLERTHSHDLASAFGKKASPNVKNGWSLLKQLFDFHFRPSNTLEPFGPVMTSGYRRTMIPDDLSDDELSFLAGTLERVSHPEYRARIGDVLWLRHKDFKSARLATEAYLEAGIAVEHPERWTYSIERYERAIRLARQVEPKGALPQSVLNHLESRVFHYNGSDPLFFTSRALELLSEFRYGDFPRLAEIAGRVAESARLSGDFRRARFYFSVQAKHLKLAKLSKEAEQVRVASARTYVEAAETHEANSSFMVAHSFWAEAIKAFRDRASLRDEIPELQRRYSAAGNKVRGEMRQVSSDTVDISKFVDESIAAVRDRPMDEAVFALVSLVRLNSPSELRRSTEKSIADQPLHAIIAASIYDATGRKIGVRPSILTEDKAEYERAISGLMEHEAAIGRNLTVHAQIAPALRQIIDDHDIGDSEVADLLGDSIFIPEDRRELFFQAFAAGFRWDFSTALHILIPQVENALRYVLTQHEIAPVNVDQHGVEELWGYERILTNPITTKIFGEDFVYELRALLVERLGPNLRNLFAHGALSPNDFQGEVALYLWWLFLRLTALPTSGMRAFIERKKATNTDPTIG